MISSARLGDKHICPLPGHGSTPIDSASADTNINFMGAARVGDTCGCGAVITTGFPSIQINGRPMAHLGSLTSHGGTIVTGSEDVLGGFVMEAALGAPIINFAVLGAVRPDGSVDDELMAVLLADPRLSERASAANALVVTNAGSAESLSPDAGESLDIFTSERKQVIDGNKLAIALSELEDAPESPCDQKAHNIYQAIAITPDLDILVDETSMESISRMQRFLEYDGFEKSIDPNDFSTDENNSYSESVKQLLRIQAPPDGKQYQLTLQKSQLSSEEKLIGYEIEMGAYFNDATLPPHFVLAETLASSQFGWAVLSVQIDRMPNRAPQIEVVTGPLTRAIRSSSEYSQAINALKDTVANSKKLQEVVDRYNCVVSPELKLVMSEHSLGYLSTGGDLSYSLAFPGNSKLVATNIQTTVQFPFLALADKRPGLDHLFAGDKQLSIVLVESRRCTDQILMQSGIPALRQTLNLKAVVVQIFFEMAANFVAGRNPETDFKSKAPLIFRTPPENIAPYIFTTEERGDALKALDADIASLHLIHIIQSGLSSESGALQLHEKIKKNIISATNTKFQTIRNRLMIAQTAGNYLKSDSGFIPADDTNKKYMFIRPSLEQTKALSPVLCAGNLYCAIELRDRSSFKGFHRSYRGSQMSSATY